MSDTRSADDVRRRRGRRLLVFVFAVFFVPLAGAWLWFANIDTWQPDGGTNNGDLIAPVWPLKAPRLQTVEGESLGGAALERKWVLVHVVGDSCDERCERNLYHTRQVRIALGKDISRVRRLLLVAAPDALAPATAREHPDLIVAFGDDLVSQIRSATAGMPAQADAIYLVDPLLNLMMRFSPDLDPRLVIKDLKKLLKVSRIG